MKRPRWLVPAIAVLLIIGVVAATQKDDRSDEVHRRRELYDLIGVHPGATLVGEEEYELIGPGDDGPSGHYSLRMTYTLPDWTMTEDVRRFYSEGLPEGWTIWGQANCDALDPRNDPGFTDEIPVDAAWVPVLPRSEIHLILPGWTPDHWPEQVGITVRVVDGIKTMTIGPSEPGCGVEGLDSYADEFDSFTS